MQKTVFFVFVLLLLSLGLFGSLSLTYCVWSKQTEVTSELQNELHNKLQSELAVMQNDLQNQLESKVQNELKKVLKVALNDRVQLGASDPSQDKGQLKRNVQQADEDTDTPSATEILTNALTEIIERKLVSYMNCDKNEYNHTKCTLRPGPKGEPEGPTGEKGTKGEQGDMGNRGEPGDKGVKGEHGYPGYKGEKGKEGVVGPQGLPGPTGLQGPRGIQGKDGVKGEQGPLGPKGDAGPQGSTGKRGEKGDMGERGLKGDMGPPGPQGEIGERGDMGQKGEPGVKGIKGNQGDPGSKGEKGEQGVGVPCGGPGWRRVVFLNMTNTSHVCPTGLNLTTYSRRTCGRAHSGRRSCSSTTFSVGGSQYSRVCGRALAYRFRDIIGFYGYHARRQGIDGQYVDGLSLTHGASGSRQHIWTFASGLFTGNRSHVYPRRRCPCDNGNTYPSPPFVGNDYFCESTASTNNWHEHLSRFIPNAKLWDGQVCEGGGTCCKFNNPPWFTKNLASSTTDDIELRLCLYFYSSNIALEQLELYVQ